MNGDDTKPCECTRCASSSSPVGYLLALLQFVKDCFGHDMTYLIEDRMHRPQLLQCKANCSLVEDPRQQIEIAIEVLTEYIRVKLNFADGAAVYEELKNSLNQKPFFYEGTRFKEYLSILGTSWDEIHATFTDPDAATIKKERLAEYLGISFKEFGTIENPSTLADTAELLGTTQAEITSALNNHGADAVKEFLKINDNELTDLLNQSLVQANGDIVNLDYVNFDVMMRIVALTRILGITSKDMIALLGVTAIRNFDSSLIEIIYRSLQAGNGIGLAGTEIGRLLMNKTDAQLIEAMGLTTRADLVALKGAANPSDDKLADAFKVEVLDIQIILAFINTVAANLDTPELNSIYQLSTFSNLLQIKPRILIKLMGGMRPAIPGLNSLETLVDTWQRFQEISSYGLEIEGLYMVKEAYSQDQLAEYLGVDKTELDNIIHPPDDGSLAALFGISLEELGMLYSLGINDGGVDLNIVTKITSMTRLELLHRPLRLARFLEINLEELKEITSKMIVQNSDINNITYDQIMEARSIVFLCRLLGLDIIKTRWLIKPLSTPADLTELEERGLNFTHQEWLDYLALADDQKRLEILAGKLGVTAADLNEVKHSIGSDLSRQGDVDVLRRIVGSALQIGLRPEELRLLLTSLPVNIDITDIDTYILMFGLCAAPKTAVDIITEVSELNDFTDIDSYKRAHWISRINALAAYLGLTIKELAGLNKWEHDIQDSDVQKLLTLMGQFYDEKQLENERQKPDERIWLATREALIQYALSQKVTIADPPWTQKELSDLLLIDLDFSPCETTTEIQQAIESVQTYIIRTQTGQEKNIPILDEQRKARMEEEWRWNQKYILWEASQKVFLYPENYIMPQLRDDKTPFYKELEDELSQGEVTNALAEKTIASYIDKLHAISTLRVAGTEYDARETKKILHIFARSQINEKETYYRTFEKELLWTPWVKLDAEINSDRVYPFLAHDRLYLFWIETEEESGQDEIKFKHKLVYIHTMEKGKWSKPRSKELSKVLSTDRALLLDISLDNEELLITIKHDFKKSEHEQYYEYYEGAWDKLPEFDMEKPIKTGTVNPAPPFYIAPGTEPGTEGQTNYDPFGVNLTVAQSEQNFAVRYTSYIFFPQKDIYTFYTNSDDGSQLFIDDILVVNNDGLHPSQVRSGTIDLQEGNYPVILTYFQKAGEKKLQTWSDKTDGARTTYQFNYLVRADRYILTCDGVFKKIGYFPDDIRFKRVLFRDASSLDIDANDYVHLNIFGSYSNSEISYEMSPQGSGIEKKLSCKTIFSSGECATMFVHKKTLRLVLFALDVISLPYLFFGSIINAVSVLSNIDEEHFQVDDAVKIGENYYFFCSDLYRSLMIVAHVGEDDICGITPVSFAISQLNYGKYCELASILFQKGLDAFYATDFQTEVLEPDFAAYLPSLSYVLPAFIPQKTLEFSGPNKVYNWELLFHIPHLIADGLNQNRKFEIARDWYHYIFNPYSGGTSSDWTFPPFRDDIITPLERYINDPEDAAAWVNDPYNPHALARVRPGAYQKAIILSYIDNLIDWADQEFTRDTRDSINLATGYYNTASQLLQLDEIHNDSPYSLVLRNLRAIIRRAVTRAKAPELIDVLPKISSLSKASIEELFENINEIAWSVYSEDIRTEIIGGYLEAAIGEVNNLPAKTLPEITDLMEEEVDTIMSNIEDYVDSMEDDQSACVPAEWRSPEEQVYPPIRLLASSFTGCIPENPIYQDYCAHIESNLLKIHSCRNIAGMQRILPVYEASADPMAIVKAVGSGAGLDALNFSNASGIGPYRFAYLIERAKSLASLVVQAGNALLLAIEKKESEELAYMRAQQELKLAKANVHLRKLGVVEAEDGLELTKKQTERASYQMEHFINLIAKDKNQFELDALTFLDQSMQKMAIAQACYSSAGQLSLIPTVSVGPTTSVSFGGSNLAAAESAKASMFSVEANIYSTQSSIAAMNASFERRKEDWEFQKALSEKDKAISEQNERIASDRIAIAQMEQQIAELSAEFADQMLQFLKEKFTNKELYAWMVKILSKILYGYYNLANATARMAQATLEFERNEALDFISYGYWDSEKKGLLSGDQLLLDINKLDDHYISNNTRKLEKTKYVSLSYMAPEALIELKSKGKTIFNTSMSWFDRDQPGHYQRIIKSIRISVLALIGPGTNFNATLSTISPSRVILNPLDPIPVDVLRIQSVALSSASNASGLFELNYRDERYLPFEGCGVDVTWELEMPKASNRFDFNSIIDVIMTIDYTALADSDYKKVVISEIGTDAGGMLPVSLRTWFPDTWYHFNNPIWLPPLAGGDDPYAEGNTPAPYSLKLTLTRQMFPPNEEKHGVVRAALRFSISDGNIRLPLRKIKFTAENGQVFERSNLKTGEGGYIPLESGFKGLLPFGVWELVIDRDTAPEALWKKKPADGTPIMENITAANPRHVLNMDKINDIIIAITYSAKLEWPEE